MPMAQVEQLLSGLLEMLWSLGECGRQAKQHLRNCLALSDRVDLLRPALQELLDFIRAGPSELSASPDIELEHLVIALDRAVRRIHKLVVRCGRPRRIALTAVHVDIPAAFNRATEDLILCLQSFAPPAPAARYVSASAAALERLTRELQSLRFAASKVSSRLARDVREELEALRTALDQQQGIATRLERAALQARKRLAAKLHQGLEGTLGELGARLEGQSHVTAVLRAVAERAVWIESSFGKRLLEGVRAQLVAAGAQRALLEGLDALLPAAVAAASGRDAEKDPTHDESGADDDSESSKFCASCNEGGSETDSLSGGSSQGRRCSEAALPQEDGRGSEGPGGVVTGGHISTMARIDRQVGQLQQLQEESKTWDERLRKQAMAAVCEVCMDLCNQLHLQRRTLRASQGLVGDAGHTSTAPELVAWELAEQGVELREQTRLVESLRHVLEARTLPAVGPLPLEWQRLKREIAASQRLLKRQSSAVRVLLPESQEPDGGVDSGTYPEREPEGAPHRQLLLDQAASYLLDLKHQLQALALAAPLVERAAAGMGVAHKQRGAAERKPPGATRPSPGSGEEQLAVFLASVWYGTIPDQEAASAALLKMKDLDELLPSAEVIDMAAGSCLAQGLVTGMNSDSCVVRAAAAAAAEAVATTDAARASLVQAHATNALAAMLSNGPLDAKRRALQALGQLASIDSAREAADAAAILALVVPMLQSESKAVVQAAAFALKGLVFLDPPRDSALLQRLRQAVVAAGGVRSLLRCLTAGTFQARAYAVGALAGLAQSPRSSVQISAHEVVPAVVPFLSLRNAEARHLAVAALASFNHSPEEVELLVRWRAVPGLVGALQSDIDSTKARAAVAISSLITLSQRNYGPLIAAKGGVPPLVALLRGSPTLTLKLLATDALSCLAEDADVRRTVLAAGALDPMVELLRDPQLGNSGRAIVTAAILELLREQQAALAFIRTGGLSLMLDLLVADRRGEGMHLAAAQVLMELLSQQQGSLVSQYLRSAGGDSLLQRLAQGSAREASAAESLKENLSGLAIVG